MIRMKMWERSRIWQEHLDLVEALRNTERGKDLYAKCKETIERVFADTDTRAI